MMLPERAAAISRWHEDAYNAMKHEGATGQRFDYQGLDLWVPADVQPITGMSHLLDEAVVAETRATDRVLDMGTGCGVNALLAARTADNAHTNGLSGKVNFEYSDVFSDVVGAFDLIIFDPPFRWFRARDLLEAGITDPGYRTLTTFFAQARSHLRPDARMLMFFSTSGDIEFFHVLSRRAKFRSEILSTASLERDGFAVEYMTMRLT